MASTRVQNGKSPMSESSPRLSRRRFTQTSAIAAAGAAGWAIRPTSSALASPTKPDALPVSTATDASTLVIMDSLTDLWRTLDPAYFYEGNPSAAMYLVYETLYHSPDAERPDDIHPMLALDLPQFSEDRLTTTIRLREGVTFANSGNRLTAADVIFSWNRLKNARFQGSYLATEYWSAIEAPDDYTLVLTLQTPNANLAAVMVALMLSISDKAAVEAVGGTDAEPSAEEDSPEMLANLAAKEEIDRASAGSGPFRIVKWDINTEVILERVDTYWGDSPAIDRVIWRNALDPNAQLQSVQIGEADIATLVNSEELDNLGEELITVQSRSLALQYLALNMDEAMSGPVASQEVRQAMAHAVDYEGIIDGLLLGNGARPATAIPLPLEGSEAALEFAANTDLTKAQQFWDASGVGQATIQIDYVADGAGRGGVNYQSLATKLQADLERIEGLTIRLAPMPAAQRSTLHRSGEFQVSLASWFPDFPGVDSFATPFYRTGASVASRSSYSDPEIDALIEQAAAELDPAIREELYVEIQRRAIEACPYIILYQPDDVKVVRVGVEGVQAHPVYQLELRGAHKSN